MKLLIYGAGVIGVTYGWQLSEVGCEITVLVKKEKKQTIAANGIPIWCTDLRNGKKHIQQVTFRPPSDRHLNCR